MSLQSLPPELLLQVLVSLPDLTTLDSLLRASPAAHRVFDHPLCAVAIFDSVLAAGALHDHVQVLIRQVALLRSGTRPFPPGYAEYTSSPVPPGIAAFRRQVVEESLRHSSRERSSVVGFAPRRLDRDTCPAVLRSLLASARRITAVALDCLDFYLHALDQFSADAGILRPAAASSSSDVSAPPHPTPPSFAWSEEQRCVRTLWRLELIFDVKRAARRGTLGWSKKDVKLLDLVDAVGRAPEDDDWWLRLQVSSFSQLWPTAAGGCGERFFYHAAAHHDCCHPGVTNPEKHEHASVVDFIRTAHGQEEAARVNRGQVSVTAFAAREAETGGSHEVARRQGAAVAGPIKRERQEVLYAATVMQRYENARLLAGRASETEGKTWLRQEASLLRRAGFALWSPRRVKELRELFGASWGT